MFIVRWIRQLIALPVTWAGQIASWISPVFGARLYGIAWTIGDSNEAAQRAVMGVARGAGEGAALSLARFWMQKRPRPGIAAMGGLIALDQGQYELACELLAAGKQAGTDRSGLVDLLEWLIANQAAVPGSPARMSRNTADHFTPLPDLAQQMAGRRDLSPQLSRMVHAHLLWEEMLERRFEEARQRAERLLQIDEMPHAEMVLWALARRDGDERRAQVHLGRVKLEPLKILMLQARGYEAIGQPAEAQQVAAEIHLILDSQAAASRSAALEPQGASSSRGGN